jgi:regulator of replication initiation timing
LIKLPQIKSEIIDLGSAMQETSGNIEALKKRIKELEGNNLYLNVKNEGSIKKQDELEEEIKKLQKAEVLN